MFRVRSCCCLDLRTGTLVIAVVQLMNVTSALYGGFGVKTPNTNDTDTDHDTDDSVDKFFKHYKLDPEVKHYMTIAYTFVTLVVFILLIIGICKKRSVFFIPYLIVNCLYCIGWVIFTFVCFAGIFILSDPENKYVSGTFVFSLIASESNGLPCVVYNKTYEHGETFSLDCRTQCACQNGTYGCSSLCPQEHISPKGSCSHPRLVDVPGQCCREWMCDSQAIQQPPECQPTFTRWSRCSATCGVGVSRRRSNLNAACEPTTETRLCQLRRCDSLRTNPFRHPADTHHHVRKGHECKATHRLTQPVRLRFGPCFSRKLFRPKHCGGCSSPGVRCEPLLSTTVKVDFLCSAPPGSTAPGDMDLALEFLEPGEDMWRELPQPWSDGEGLQITVSVQWILKCRCGIDPDPQVQPTAASGEIILHRVHRTAAP